MKKFFWYGYCTCRRGILSEIITISCLFVIIKMLWVCCWFVLGICFLFSFIIFEVLRSNFGIMGCLDMAMIMMFHQEILLLELLIRKILLQELASFSWSLSIWSTTGGQQFSYHIFFIVESQGLALPVLFLEKLIAILVPIFLEQLVKYNPTLAFVGLLFCDFENCNRRI